MSRIFGDIIQNGYVVRDIAAAMRHWIEVLGVGPWFYIEHLSVPDFTYKGQPSPSNSRSWLVHPIRPMLAVVSMGNLPSHLSVLKPHGSSKGRPIGSQAVFGHCPDAAPPWRWNLSGVDRIRPSV
jgi:hypothetical protein